MSELNQHDVVTRKVLSRKSYAVDFLKNTLSGKITSKLDFSRLKIYYTTKENALRIFSTVFLPRVTKNLVYFAEVMYNYQDKFNKLRTFAERSISKLKLLY